MEQKFLLKEIDKHLSDIEESIGKVRELIALQLKSVEPGDVKPAETETVAAAVENVAAELETPVVEVEKKVSEVEKPVQRVDGRLISDLKKVIGLNDRIRFCRDLFGGDSKLMDSTIEYLNDASSYIEALEYLAENFNWDDENDTVKYFKDILSRKSYL